MAADEVLANTTAGVLGVAAFAVSFTHVRDTATAAGQRGWVAVAIAVSVELMALAAVTEIRRRGRRGQRAAWPWFVLVLGVAMSLAANLATAQPTAWGYVMAGWPAVAFLSVATMLETRPVGPTRTPPTGRPVRDALPAAAARTVNAAGTTHTDGNVSARTDLGARTGQPAFRTKATPRTDSPPRTNDRSRTEEDTARTDSVPAMNGVPDTGRRAIPTDAAVSADNTWRADSTPGPETVSGHPGGSPVRPERTSAPIPTRTAMDSPALMGAAAIADNADADLVSAGTAAGGMPGLPYRPARARMVAWLSDALRADPSWTPDYPALMDRTGYGRSWCEKCLADARQTVWGDLADLLGAKPPTSPLG